MDIMAVDTSKVSSFSTDLLFCPVCGSVLPLPEQNKDHIPCSRCPFVRDMKGKYIRFSK